MLGMTGHRTACLWLMVLAVIIILGFPAFCPVPVGSAAFAGDEKAGPEAVIWQNVQRLFKEGKELEACKAAVELEKYSDTDTYKTAKKVMARYGISPMDPLGGYTIKQIIKLQNVLEPVRRKEGKMPTVGVRKSFKDAWGMPLRVEMVARGSYIYIIRSAGPDKRYITADDYIIGVRGKHSIIESKVQSMEDSSRQKGKAGLLKGRDAGRMGDGTRASPAPRMATPSGKSDSGDYQVDLNDLLNKK